MKEKLISWFTQEGNSSRQWRSHLPFILLLLAFVCNATLWAAVSIIRYPPDESAHYEYVLHLTTAHALPIYGQSANITGVGLNTHASLPPLYYLLGTPVLTALRGAPITEQILALRLISILLGAITVGLAYKFGRMLVPSRPEFALAVGAVVGFNPMFTYLSASINSDNLVNLLHAALLPLLAYGLRQRQPSRGWLIGLGALLGAGLITKQSIIMGVLVSALVLLYLAWRERPRFLSTLARYGLWVSTPAVLISGWYFLRNWKLYGHPTGFVAGVRPDIYPAGPYQKIGPFWEMIFAAKGVPFLSGLFRGYWGIFDHYEILMSIRVYVWFAVMLGGGLIGLAVWIIRRWGDRQESLTRQRLELAAIGGLLAALSIAAVTNLSYFVDYQPQGRYLFAALVPVAVAIVGGWEQLAGLVNLRWLVVPLMMTTILAINFIALVFSLAPAHHNRYLGKLLYTPPAFQQVYDTAPAESTFVPRHAEIAQLEMFLKILPGSSGPLIWRVIQPDAPGDLLRAIVQQPQKGPARYAIDVSSGRFKVGQTYILRLEAPAVSAQQPLLTAFTGPDANGPSSLADMRLQVVYPTALNRDTIQRAEYLVRSAPLRSLRGGIQRVFYPLVAILLLALAAVSSWPLLMRPRRLAILLLILGLGLANLWPAMRDTDEFLPTFRAAALHDQQPGIP